MDLRVKLVNVPSVLDMVRRHGRAQVNGLRFGYSDKLGAYVSEEASHAEVESFRRVPGYVIIDAHDGSLVSEPERVILRAQDDGQEDPELRKLPMNPEEEWLNAFTERFKATPKNAHRKLDNDELKRALRASNVVVNGELKKGDLVTLFAETIGEKAETDQGDQGDQGDETPAETE